MSERWLPILETKALYSVSSLGRIRRGSRILKLQRDGLGYFKVALSCGGKPVQKKVHRLVAGTFLERIPKYHQINHIDGDKTNNVVDNLEIVTCRANHAHAHQTGLNKNHGETHCCARLSDAQVQEIRDIFTAGKKSQKGLACQFSVGRDHISRIVNYKARTNKWGSHD